MSGFITSNRSFDYTSESLSCCYSSEHRTWAIRAGSPMTRFHTFCFVSDDFVLIFFSTQDGSAAHESMKRCVAALRLAASKSILRTSKHAKGPKGSTSRRLPNGRDVMDVTMTWASLVNEIARRLEDQDVRTVEKLVRTVEDVTADD